MQKDLFYLDNPDIAGIPCDRFTRLSPNAQSLLEPIYNSTTQSIELEKLYGLKVRERRAAGAFLTSQTSVQKEAAQLVIKVSEESGESIEAIAKAMDDPEKQIAFFSNHLDELQALQQKQQSITEDLALVTTVLQSRANAGWELEDTLDLPESLYYAIRNYIDQERAGWPDADAPKIPSSNQSDDPPTQPQKSPTGKTSTSKSKTNLVEASS